MGCCLPVCDCCFCVIVPELGAGKFDENSKVLQLEPDNRQLGYLIVGADVESAKRHIFFHHGILSSRIQVNHFDLSYFPDTCIIAVDRPGTGLSHSDIGRNVNEHAQDVIQLADHLKIEKFCVVGHSAGGPYALAARATIPHDRLIGVVCVAGLAPLDVVGTEGMLQKDADCLADARKRARIERMGKWFVGNCCCPITAIPESELVEMPKADQDLIRAHPDIGEWLLKSFQEALRDNNLETFEEDWYIYSHYDRWGFKIEDIRGDVPLAILQGDDDNDIPLTHAKWYAKAQGSKLFIAKGHGHLSVLDSEELSKFLDYVFSGRVDSYPGFKPADSNEVTL